MTPADTPAFRAALRRLETAYGAGVDPARDPVFFDALEAYPITAVIAAARDLERRRPPSGRMPTTHDWADRCSEIRRGELAQHPTHTSCPPPHDDDTPPMTQAEFVARLDTLRKKLARIRPGARPHSSLIPLSQIADGLTHPRTAIATMDNRCFDLTPDPAAARPLPSPREPGDDDLPFDDTPVQPDGAEDDPDAV